VWTRQTGGGREGGERERERERERGRGREGERKRGRVENSRWIQGRKREEGDGSNMVGHADVDEGAR
jgi:hypothetical protein